MSNLPSHDFPENVPPDQVFVWTGKTYLALLNLLKAIWRGDNVQMLGNTLKKDNGPAGYALVSKLVSSLSGAFSQAWNFKVYDASVGTTFQVIVNSGDGFAGSINGNPAMLNGGVITTPILPAVAPLLSTPSTGFIFIKVYLNPDGSINPSAGEGTGVDILWSSSQPLQLDTASPPTYATQLIAQNTVAGSPQVQVVDNQTNYGFTSFFLCGTLAQFS